MTKTFKMIAWFIILIVILSSVYYFLVLDKGGNLSQKEKLANELVVVQKKLSIEKEKLSTMTAEMRKSFAFEIGVQDQMKNATSLVAKSDFMFISPNGPDPQLLVKNLLPDLPINTERKDINALLKEWEKETDISNISSIDVVKAEKIKKDGETIKNYIEDINNIVKKLTPENSGLSQAQISAYLAQLPTIDSINKVLAILQDLINKENSNQQNKLGGNSSLDAQHIVTPTDIAREQVIVDSTQTQVQVIQDQLSQGEVQPPSRSQDQAPPRDTTPPIPDPNVQGGTNGDNQGSIQDSNNPISKEPIIIQPGVPQLIQGTNQY